MARLKTAPNQIMCVADNTKKDFLAPNRLGFITVQIVRPKGVHKTKPSSKEYAAKYKIHKISQLLKILKNI